MWERRRRQWQLHWPEFNPPTGEGGGADSNPCRIASIAQQRRQISTRNFQFLFQNQFEAFQQKSADFLSVLATSWFAILGEKGKCLKAARMPHFEATRDWKCKRTQNWMLYKMDIYFLSPEYQNCDFSKRTINKIHHFQDSKYPIKQNISKKYPYKHHTQNFKATSNLIPGKGDNITF